MPPKGGSSAGTRKTATSSTAAAAAAAAAKNPNVLYPPHDVPIPMALPSAKRLTTSAPDIAGDLLGAAHSDPHRALDALAPLAKHGPHFPAPNLRKLQALPPLPGAQRKKIASDARPVAVLAPVADVGSSAPGPAAAEMSGAAVVAARAMKTGSAARKGSPPAAHSAGRKALVHPPAAAAPAAAAATAASNAAGHNRKTDTGSRRSSAAPSGPAPPDPGLLAAIAAIPAIPHPAAARLLGRPITPPPPRHDHALEITPSVATHPIDPFIRQTYESARDARQAADEAAKLEAAVPFQDLKRAQGGVPRIDSGGSNNNPPSVAARRWRAMVAWEDDNGARLGAHLDQSIVAFADATESCIKDFSQEQQRLGSDVVAICRAMRESGIHWTRRYLEDQLARLRHLVEQEAATVASLESTLAWLQEDAAGFAADSVDLFRASLLDPLEKGGDPHSLAAMVSGRAHAVHLLAHRELIRAGKGIMAVRRVMCDQILAMQAITTQLYETHVAPAVRWAREQWQLEHALQVISAFRALHSDRSWVTTQVGAAVVGILEETLHQCKAASAPPLPEAEPDTSIRSGASGVGGGMAESLRGTTGMVVSNPEHSLPFVLDQAAMDKAARRIQTLLSDAYAARVRLVTDACEQTVTEILDCTRPWPEQLVNDTTIGIIATELGLDAPPFATMPWHVGRALALPVRRNDWRYCIATLSRTVMQTMENLCDRLRVARRYARCVHDLWTTQQAEIERVMRMLDTQLAESQHAHDTEISDMRHEIARCVNEMDEAETEKQCIAAFEQAKSVMDELEHAYSSRARQVTSLVSGTDAGAIQKFDMYQQRWADLLGPLGLLARAKHHGLSLPTNQAVDVAALRAKIGEFERTRRPTQVGFAVLQERIKPGMELLVVNAAAPGASGGNNGKMRQARVTIPTGQVPGASELPGPLAAGTAAAAAAAKRAKVNINPMGLPTSINFQRSTRNQPSPVLRDDDSASLDAARTTTTGLQPTRQLHRSASGVERLTLTSPLNTPDDVEPLEYTMRIELDALLSLVTTIFAPVATLLDVWLRDMGAGYHSRFAEWRTESVATLDALETVSMKRTANQHHMQGYTHERQNKQLQSQFTQRLLTIQAVKHAARRVAKDRQKKMVVLARQWTPAVEMAEGIMQSFLQRMLATHDKIQSELTVAELTRRRREATKLCEQGITESAKLLDPIIAQWNEISAQVSEMLEEARADGEEIRPFTPGPEEAPTTPGPAPSKSEVAVVSVDGLAEKLDAVSTQIHEGSQRVVKVRLRLHDALAQVDANIQGYLSELALFQRAKTAITRAKTMARGKIMADQLFQQSMLLDLEQRVGDIAASLDFRPTAADLTRGDYWSQLSSQVVRLMAIWQVLQDRRQSLGMDGTVPISALSSSSSKESRAHPLQFGEFVGALTPLKSTDLGNRTTSTAKGGSSGTRPALPVRSGTSRAASTNATPAGSAHSLRPKGILRMAGGGSTASSRQQLAGPAALAALTSVGPARLGVVDALLAKVSAELATQAPLVVPSHSWLPSARSWVMIDALVMEMWAHEVLDEVQELANVHYATCAADIDRWLTARIPQIAMAIVDTATRALERSVATDWAQLVGQPITLMQATVHKDVTERRAAWEAKLWRWRFEAADHQGQPGGGDPVTSLFANWERTLGSENAAWLASSVDAPVQSMLSDTLALASRQLATTCFLMGATAVLTQVVPRSSSSSPSHTETDASCSALAWMSGCHPLIHTLLGNGAASKMMERENAVAGTVLAARITMHIRMILGVIMESYRAQANEIEAASQQAKDALSTWHEGCLAITDVVRQQQSWG
ncbi:hypothetical protein BC828DRAFT_269582 [Blastocladiella britannica]|nr:hypothetical protein BC828DRAFT_269582 [Blastocladiella britannica]